MNRNKESKIEYNPTFGGFLFTLMICAYVIISFLGQLLLTLFGVTNGVLYYAVNSTFSVIAIFLVIVPLKAKRQEKGLFGRYFKKFSLEYVFLAVVFAFGMFMGLGFLNSLIEKAFQGMGVNSSSSALPLNGFLSYIVFVVFYAVLPAVVEEIFFRGLLYENLQGCNKVLTALCIAFAFSVYHGSVYQTIYQFIYGLGLTVLVIKSGSIIPGVIAHFVNNFAVLTIEYFKIPFDLFNPITVVIGIALLVFFVLFMLLSNRRTEKPLQESVQKSEEKIGKFFIPYGIFGIAVCVLTIVLGVLI